MADRTIAEWKLEIADDMGLIKRYVERALNTREDDAARPKFWASALKETRRMESDLYRMAEVAGVSREEINAVSL